MEIKKVKNAAFQALKWSSGSQILEKAASVISNMLLARILAPEAFGVVATMTMVITFIDTLSEAGFQKYLIQKDFEKETSIGEYANVAFFTNIAAALGLWLLIIIFRDQISLAVGNPGLGGVLAIACLQLPIKSSSSVPFALLLRSLNLKITFRIKAVSVFVPFIITIPMALLGLGYWALIFGAIFTQLTNAILLHIYSCWKPKLFYSFKLLREMFSFSCWSMVEAFTIWLSSWIDVFIIGSYLSDYYLGIYKTSVSMVNSLIMLVSGAITPIMFATLSRLKNQEKEFSATFYRIQTLTTLVIVPMGVGVFLFSDFATHILLGSKWMDASNVIGIWALTLSIKTAIGNPCSEVYRSLGRPKYSVLVQSVYLAVMLPICLLSVQYGFLSIVYARAWVQVILLLIHFAVLQFILKMSISKMLRNFIPIATAIVVMTLFAYSLRAVAKTTIWSIISIVLCSAIYLVVLIIIPITRKELAGLSTMMSLSQRSSAKQLERSS